MAISKDEVQRIAKLAKFEFTDDEIDQFTDQFGHILGMFEELQTVDTTDVPVMSWAIDKSDVMRADEAQQGTDRDVLFRNVKSSENGFIKVPAIIDTEGGNA
ncbi:Asp-tRNA(Asn)/Glu-tRNA(Gln) amidotransferase subunit GatC [Aerococcus suis]|uniref:Aspartyl/glutamyl-tRNA(Asn/Gln) amidotransferase subunit C n=1 Tax=Aerococcus suis TaxID=371602 RepID=A0A1W1Z8J7_9LACT|nr:Asp-tRNA(Asn)/Glu-tRNA(Gln) amidotransferase subunit GatC [Aerococcus suis]MDD7758556.1 Asp-tRNA(Asn)/Glu-tRNA(Gln) amidotransferase subunit GatC [Aerococcus suis]MDY4646581.1 Asp-tRNA(Asn)/Glu-tRNA(Gln) amidotransferase subunit GatC [Aerococcus suis]SMC44696.1 aspartyl/glutamyl-tRNA(Asn/Gln) amidotransferase subunit C [Aerococcus suis]